MAGVMLLAMAFSSFFIALHADHDCMGEDCPICACIQQCEKTMRGTGSDMIAISAVIAPVFITLLTMSFNVSSFQWDTPVSIKVRLNN